MTENDRTLPPNATRTDWTLVFLAAVGGWDAGIIFMIVLGILLKG